MWYPTTWCTSSRNKYFFSNLASNNRDIFIRYTNPRDVKYCLIRRYNLNSLWVLIINYFDTLKKISNYYLIKYFIYCFWNFLILIIMTGNNNKIITKLFSVPNKHLGFHSILTSLIWTAADFRCSVCIRRWCHCYWHTFETRLISHFYWYIKTILINKKMCVRNTDKIHVNEKGLLVSLFKRYNRKIFFWKVISSTLQLLFPSA